MDLQGCITTYLQAILGGLTVNRLHWHHRPVTHVDAQVHMSADCAQRLLQQLLYQRTF